MRKSQIDRDVTLETGVGQRRVKLVTQVFLDKVMRALIAGEEVTLDNFGRFKLVQQGGAPPPNRQFHTGKKNTATGLRWRVHFRRSTAFTEAVKQHNLENTDGEVRGRRKR